MSGNLEDELSIQIEEALYWKFPEDSLAVTRSD